MSTNGSYTTANFMKLEITKKGSFYKSFDSHDVNVEIAGEDSALQLSGADTFSVFLSLKLRMGSLLINLKARMKNLFGP